ncbi:murein biosynthesis integral membrane protein MurJ [Terrisporobacter petrolearius]|uniref:murein biosynthesis integral membrane protein MurJ n=1 Tax=Terrisporobacter petrolearius TaxID=1460447 RepID=UPI001D16E0A6|nr:murein biosynthesis integral membrane protein MurJ [Terrisporobacter petrolearius]MCC3862740.1 murein biosynthesis integral membrane protein MurJ [Terrisporobacter petrolearius]
MSKIAKATIGLMIATILTKILGFARSLVLASSYGANMYSDAYIVAMNIPIVIVASIGAAISTILIPMYSEINSNSGEKKALEFTNNILNIVVIICLILSILGFIFTEPLVKLFAIGFGAEKFSITVDFTRILLISIVFSGISFIMTSYLQIKNRFTITGLITIPRNIIIIISTILSTKFGPYVMVWGTLVGLAMDLLFMIPFAVKEDYKYKLYINIKDEYVKKCLLLLGPVLIGVSVNQLNTMIDRNLASALGDGIISALSYANKLNTFVMALFISSISVVIYPILSKQSNDKDNKKFIQSIVKSVNSVTILVIPISVGAIVLATPIVKLLFQRGAFDTEATHITAVALAMYSIGMTAFGVRDILGKVFYSIQDTKTPMVNGIIAIILNIVLNLILIKYIGYAGLALATSISALVCVMLLFRSLKRKIGYFGQDKIFSTTVKSIVAAIVMGIIINVVFKYTISLIGVGLVKEVITLIISVGIGAIVYGLLIIILKVDETKLIIDMVKKKIRK